MENLDFEFQDRVPLHTLNRAKITMTKENFRTGIYVDIVDQK